MLTYTLRTLPPKLKQQLTRLTFKGDSGMRDALRYDIHNKKHEIIVLECDNKAIAWALWYYYEDKMWCSVYCNRKYRGRGFGKQLVEEMFKKRKRRDMVVDQVDFYRRYIDNDYLLEMFRI